MPNKTPTNDRSKSWFKLRNHCDEFSSSGIALCYTSPRPNALKTSVLHSSTQNWLSVCCCWSSWAWPLTTKYRIVRHQKTWAWPWRCWKSIVVIDHCICARHASRVLCPWPPIKRFWLARREFVQLVFWNRPNGCKFFVCDVWSSCFPLRSNKFPK